jgi:antitoxin CptB
MHSGQDRLKKLRWQSRRGMKELDVLFEAFLAQHTESLIEGDWPQLEELLKQEDDVLYDWISGRNLPDDPKALLLIKTIANVL